MKLERLCELKFDPDIDINLSGRSFKIDELPPELPRKITSSFYCFGNRLTSLAHYPSEIGGTFECGSNLLTSLEYCPSIVGGDFMRADNRLPSLENIHEQIKKIGGEFWCFDNPIKSHILGLMLIDIGGNITTDLGDGEDVDMILNKWKNQGRKGVLGAQRELLELGYAELAQL